MAAQGLVGGLARTKMFALVMFQLTPYKLNMAAHKPFVDTAEAKGKKNENVVEK